MQVTLTADEAAIERVARALFAKYSEETGLELGWDDLLADPEHVRKSGYNHGDALRVWRDYARVAIDALVSEEPVEEPTVMGVPRSKFAAVLARKLGEKG